MPRQRRVRRVVVGCGALLNQLSLFLAAFSAAAWITSYFTAAELKFHPLRKQLETACQVLSDSGACRVSAWQPFQAHGPEWVSWTMTRPANPRYGWPRQLYFEPPHVNVHSDAKTDAERKRHGLAPLYYIDGRSWSVEFGWWLPTIGFSLLPLTRSISWWRKRRFRPGQCSRCGYDLTGNVSGRCPECGASVPFRSQAPLPDQRE